MDKGIPFDPSLRVDEWEYRTEVFSLPVSFQTGWQLYAGANDTYKALKQAFPKASVQLKRRRVPKVEDITP